MPGDIEAAVAGGRGAPDRQARRRQGLGGDRAGLYAARALRRRRACLCRGAPAARRGPVPPRRLRRSACRRGGRRRHRQGARGLRRRRSPKQPGQPQARFYLALAAEQDGKKADAIRAYERLLADAPPDAPWRRARSARASPSLKGEPAPAEASAGAPAPFPKRSRPMIEGMVNRLATRLASNGGSVDEWSRLIRAYTVLHEADKAKAALADARKALAPDAERGRQPRRARARPRPRRRQLTRRGRRLTLIAAALAVVGAAVGPGALCDERQHSSSSTARPKSPRRRSSRERGCGSAGW